MTHCSPLTSDLKIECPRQESYIRDIEITEEKIREKLHLLKAHKSSGPDDVHVNVLKNCPAMSISLAMLFNRSFNEGYLPQDWRDANICPIHKKGDRAQAMNFRPVSLTSQVVKLMERLVLDSITSHLVENNIISCEQHGFQRGSSCVTQLLECFDDWLTNLDENLGTDILYLDFTKAFDCISHTHLLYKLEHYGIKGKLLRWLSAFLRNRRQRVVSQQTFSNWEPIISGVPQGALLSPTMFLLYINDLPAEVESSAKLFADDTKIYRTISCEEDAAKLQRDLNRLAAWSDTWKMNFNAEKCAVVQVKKGTNFVYTLNGKKSRVYERAKGPRYTCVLKLDA